MRLTGERVVLRPITADDVDALVELFAEPAVAAWWSGYDRGRIVREMVEEDDPAGAFYVVDLDGELAGMVQTWDETDPEYRSASVDIAIAPRWHGRGVAVDALRTIVSDLVTRRGHHHLTIDPAASNGRAIACYRKVGFKPVGVLRRNELGPDGTFHDTLLMDLVAPDDLDDA